MFTLVALASLLLPTLLAVMGTMLCTMLVSRAATAPYVAEATDGAEWMVDLEWELLCAPEYEHDTVEAIDAVWCAILETVTALDEEWSTYTERSEALGWYAVTREAWASAKGSDRWDDAYTEGWLSQAV